MREYVNAFNVFRKQYRNDKASPKDGRRSWDLVGNGNLSSAEITLFNWIQNW